MYYTYIVVLLQYSKPFTSIFKAQVHTNTTMTHMHIAWTQCLDIRIHKLTGFSVAFVSFFYGILLYKNEECRLTIKLLHTDLVILVKKACIVLLIYLTIEVMKHTIKSLPLQKCHLASRVITKLNNQIIKTVFDNLNIGRYYI